MFTGRNGNDQRAVRLQPAAVQIVGRCDCLRGSAIAARNRSQRITLLDLVVPPPHPHLRWNRRDRAQIFFLASGGQMKLKLLTLGSGHAQQAGIQILQFRRGRVHALRHQP